ncbi:zinc ABC transporter ATP-binding protein, partial [Dehalococcoides mccartyi]
MPVVPALVVKGVTASFDGLAVLEDITVSQPTGRMLGIIGPNGGGKTTLLKLILGLIQPDCGTIKVLGKSPEDARPEIGYVSQYHLFDRDFPISVLEVVLMGRYSKRGLAHSYRKEDVALAEEYLDKVGMLPFINRQIGQLSGGQQKRVFIARALVNQPKLLILDEPTAGVDAAMQTGLYELLESLKKDMTIIMVTHDISAVAVCIDD